MKSHTPIQLSPVISTTSGFMACIFIFLEEKVKYFVEMLQLYSRSCTPK